jgi:hypothetical protein
VCLKEIRVFRHFFALQERRARSNLYW